MPEMPEQQVSVFLCEGCGCELVFPVAGDRALGDESWCRGEIVTWCRDCWPAHFGKSEGSDG